MRYCGQLFMPNSATALALLRPGPAGAQREGVAGGVQLGPGDGAAIPEVGGAVGDGARVAAQVFVQGQQGGVGAMGCLRVSKPPVLGAASGFAMGPGTGQRLANIYRSVEQLLPWV